MEKEERPILCTVLFSGHRLSSLYLSSALSAPALTLVLPKISPTGLLLLQVAHCLLFDRLSPVTSGGQSLFSFWDAEGLSIYPPFDGHDIVLC